MEYALEHLTGLAAPVGGVKTLARNDDAAAQKCMLD